MKVDGRVVRVYKSQEPCCEYYLMRRRARIRARLDHVVGLLLRLLRLLLLLLLLLRLLRLLPLLLWLLYLLLR